MYRHCFLPSYDELSLFCLPRSTGKNTRPLDHNVNRKTGLKDFSLHFITNGKGYIELQDQVFPLTKGDAFLHTPFQNMRYYTSEDDRWEISWVQFYGTGLDSYLLERGFHESSIWHMKEIEPLEQAFMNLIEEVERDNFIRPAKLSALTFTVLIEFIYNSVPFSIKRNNRNVDLIIQLLPIMQKNSHKPFILEEWADQVKLTPNYFCSLFKKVTKLTPLAYITKCRIQFSKKMLLDDPQMQIKEVAISTGYPSVSYFNKVFRNQEGITPGEFRKLHQHL